MKKFEFKNRELSWLEFNERVLQEAQDKTVPIIERIRFIGIFSNNLDEFFKVRYATVKRIAVSPQKNRKLYKGLTAKDLLSEINKKTIEVQNKSSKILNSIKSDLKKENIFFVDEKTIPSTQIDKIYSFFSEKILPQMEVIIFDKSNSFPVLKDSNSFLIVKIQIETQSIKYALIKIPEQLNRFFVIDESDKKYVIFIDDIIRYHLVDIFKIFKPKKILAFNIKMTRDAELDFAYDISKSYLEKISQSLKKRQRGKPVRLVYDSSIHDDTLSFLIRKMGINKNLFYIIAALPLFISLNVNSSDSIPTIKEYIDNPESYDSYVFGLESGLEWASEYYYRKHNIQLYCKPGNVQLPAEMLREMIAKTISTKPGFFKKYENEQLLGLALRNGYMQAFPCQ